MAHTVTIYELTLGRVLDYLTQCNVELTPAVVHEVLRLCERALDDGKEDLLPRVFAALPEHIELPPPSAPRPAPPIHRQSGGGGGAGAPRGGPGGGRPAAPGATRW